MVNESGRIEDYLLYKKYITLALVIGQDHLHPYNMEIIAIDKNGDEQNYKSELDAGEKLGLARSNINRVLRQGYGTVGGLKFIYAK